MSMSILILILVIVITATIIALYATSHKFESAILTIAFIVYLVYIIMALL